MTATSINCDYNVANTAQGVVPNSAEGVVAQILRGTPQVLNNQLYFPDAPGSNPLVVWDCGVGDYKAQCNVSGSGGDCLYFRVQDADNWWRIRAKVVQSTQYYSYFNGTYTYGSWTFVGTECYAYGDDAWYVGTSYWGDGGSGVADANTATYMVVTYDTTCGPADPLTGNFGHVGYNYSRTATPNYSTGSRTVNTRYVVLERCVAGSISQIGIAQDSDTFFVAQCVGQAISIINSSNAVILSGTDQTFTNKSLVGQGLGGPSDVYGTALDNLSVTPLVYDPTAPTLLLPINESYVDLASGANFSAEYNNANASDLPIARRARRMQVGGSAYEYEQTDGTWGPTEADIPITATTRTVTVKYTWTNDQWQWSWAFQGGDTGGWSPYADDQVVVGNQAPTITITSPIGPVTDTNRPIISFVYSDPDGDPQIALEAKVFTDDVVKGSGFDPNTSTAVEVLSKTSTASNEVATSVSLINGTTYWAFVKAYQTGNLDSGWVSSSFTIDVSAPAKPTLLASYDPDIAGTNISVQGHDNLASEALASGETGLAWTAESNCTVALDATEFQTGSQSVKTTVISAGDAVIESEEIDVNGVEQLVTAMSAVLGSTSPAVVVLSADCFDASGKLIATVKVAEATEQVGVPTQPTGGGGPVTPPDQNPPPGTITDYGLYYSTSSDRNSPVALDGATVSGGIYIIAAPADNVTQVQFWLDAAESTTPYRTESNAPFDFNGGQVVNGVDTAVVWDTTQQTSGSHTISARFTFTNGQIQDVSATFTINTTVPSAPTNVTASSTVQGEVDISWAAPASDGGSPITGYTINISGQAPVSVPANQTSDSITGLTAGSTVTVTISAENANGTGTESNPITLTVAVPAPTGGTGGGGTPSGNLSVSMGIGPNGLRWATRTPAAMSYDTICWNGSVVPGTSRQPDKTVTSASALLSALQSATSGQWIHCSKVGSSNWGNVSIDGLSSSGWAQNVLMTADPGLQINDLDITSPNTSWCGFEITGHAYAHPGAHNTKLIRQHHVSGAQLFVTGADNVEWVEVVAPDRPATQADRGQIKAYQCPPPNGWVAYGCWIEGTALSSSSTNHGDVLQWMAMLGLHIFLDTYDGCASNNGNTQIKNEFQGGYTNPATTTWTMPDGSVARASAGAAYGTMARYNSFFNGAQELGQGNSTSQTGPDYIVNCQFGCTYYPGHERLLVNELTLLKGCKLKTMSGASESSWPDNTYGVTVSLPTKPSQQTAPWIWW